MKRMIVFVVFIWLCGCESPKRQPVGVPVTPLSEVRSENDFLPPLGDLPVRTLSEEEQADLFGDQAKTKDPLDFPKIQKRLDELHKEFLQAEADRRKKVEEERLRKRGIFNGWSEVLETSREKVEQTLAAALETDKSLTFETEVTDDWLVVRAKTETEKLTFTISEGIVSANLEPDYYPSHKNPKVVKTRDYLHRLFDIPK